MSKTEELNPHFLCFNSKVRCSSFPDTTKFVVVSGVIKLINIYIFFFKLKKVAVVGICSSVRGGHVKLTLCTQFPSVWPHILGDTIPAPRAQWLCHRLMGWYVLGSYLGTGSNTEWIFKDPHG